MNTSLTLRANLVALAVAVFVILVNPVAAQSPPDMRPVNAVVKMKATLKGHRGTIVEIAFSPDGTTIATGSEDGTVRLWDAQTAEPRATLKLTKKLSWLTLAWSPDSRRLATCWYRGFGLTKEAQIWDAQTGELRATLKGHRSAINSLNWSPDSQTLLTASDDGTARVWDGATGELERTIEYESVDTSRETDSLVAAVFTRKKIPPARLINAQFAAGGRSIVISSFGKPPQLWTADGQLLTPLVTLFEILSQTKSSFPYYPRPLVSPDGLRIAIKERDGLLIWDALTGKLRHTLVEAGRPHLFTPDGRTLITDASYDELVDNAKWLDAKTAILKLWEVETGEVRSVLKNVTSDVSGIYWSPDSQNMVVVGSGTTKARLLDARTGTLKAKLPYGSCTSDSLFGNGGCEPFIFNADGRITSKLTGALKLFDTATGQLIATLDATNRRAAFSPTDARLLAARTKDKRSIMLFEVAAR
jgi:WD40 repeat protein